MLVSKDNWIEVGYTVFALQGPKGIKIEALSKQVKVSKSSFYHYFADVEIFIGHLAKHHLVKSAIIARKENNAQSIDPDLINILVEHKIDLLFNRQLRINRENKLFQDTLIKSNNIIGNGFVNLWAKDLRLNLSNRQLQSIFELALENFYLQINPENLNTEWLSAYFSNLRTLAKNLQS